VLSKEAGVKIFDEMGGERYDQRNLFFKPVHDNLQFLNNLILKDLPKDARILCVGVGTGSDILGLAESNTSWSFVGIDPAISMLKRCEEKLKEKRLMNRCELFHGFLSDYKSETKFDALLCLFVMHFVGPLEERSKMFSGFASLLKKNGILINTEISVDINSPEYKQLLENWKQAHRFAGASEEILGNMANMVEKQLSVISPEQTKKLIVENGFKNPIHFFQSFLIRGWHSTRS
jgi:tRNA (cmo5U34)-methyltransferase